MNFPCSCAFSFFERISFSICRFIISSSIFSNRSPPLLTWWHAGNKEVFPESFHEAFSRFSHSLSFFIENGRNGSRMILRLPVICSEMFNIVLTLSMSDSISFHGSVSARYLFPSLARFSASLSASLNLKFSIPVPVALHNLLISFRTFSSYSFRVPRSGTMPEKCLSVRTRVRLTKLPSIATSSLLLRA